MHADGGALVGAVHFEPLAQAFGIALALDFFIRKSGEETGIAAGENALLLLALGCILTGIHFERMFVLIGLLLTLVLIFVAKIDQYLWLLLVAGVLAIVVLGAFWWYFHDRSRKHLPMHAAGTAS